MLVKRYVSEEIVEHWEFLAPALDRCLQMLTVNHPPIPIHFYIEGIYETLKIAQFEGKLCTGYKNTIVFYHFKLNEQDFVFPTAEIVSHEKGVIPCFLYELDTPHFCTEGLIEAARLDILKFFNLKFITDGREDSVIRKAVSYEEQIKPLKRYTRCFNKNKDVTVNIETGGYSSLAQELRNSTSDYFTQREDPNFTVDKVFGGASSDQLVCAYLSDTEQILTIKVLDSEDAILGACVLIPNYVSGEIYWLNSLFIRTEETKRRGLGNLLLLSVLKLLHSDERFTCFNLGLSQYSGGWKARWSTDVIVKPGLDFIDSSLAELS